MKKIFLTGITALAILGMAAPASAANWVLDFDHEKVGDVVQDVARNTIFGNDNAFQRYTGANGIPGSTAGVKITAHSKDGFDSGCDSGGCRPHRGQVTVPGDPSRPYTEDYRYAVGYDSTVDGRNRGITENTEDPDLLESDSK